MSVLMRSKACRAGSSSAAKCSGALLRRSAWSGAAMAEKLATNDRHQPAKPKKLNTSFLVRGSGNCSTASTDAGSIDTVSPSTMWPRCFIRSYPARHLRGLSTTWRRRHVASTRRSLPTKALQSSSPPAMSSMKTEQTLSACSAWNDSSMCRWKVLGALHKPNIITRGWKSPWCVTNAALARSSGANGICQYPEKQASPNL
mmetsp:Transcript_9993/g.40518  ORF Transcript_9993/g.40518 Transcript_9993/m.40518 type:complete len:201 (+) Transcript_9993:2422-3024(+)